VCRKECDSPRRLCGSACLTDAQPCNGTCSGAQHNCGGTCAADTSVTACGPACKACVTPAKSKAIPSCNGTTCVYSEWTTDWFNRDAPSGDGDGEHLDALIAEGYAVCAHPKEVHCRRQTDMVDWTKTGQVMTCTPEGGSVCLNHDQPGGQCDDYEVQFVCPMTTD
jgi:hypothetical protein